MKTRTVSIRRYHVWGTSRHHVRAEYRGDVLTWVTSDPWTRHIADCPHWGQDAIEAMRAHALRQGFTHCRFVGDWQGLTKPQGGKLKPAQVQDFPITLIGAPGHAEAQKATIARLLRMSQA